MRVHVPLLGLTLLLSMVACIATPALSGSVDSTYVGTDLRASTERPWNPPAAVPAAERWESVLRFPGRIVSLPLSALGRAADLGLLHVEQDRLDIRVKEAFAFQRRVQFAVTPASLGDRTGFGGAVLWSPPFTRGHVLADVSGSTNHYNRERMSVTFGPWRGNWSSEWRARDLYYGVGMSAPKAGAAAFAERLQSVRLTVSIPWRRLPEPTPSGATASSPVVIRGPERSRANALLWVGSREAVLATGRDPRRPSFDVLYPADAANLGRPVEHFIYGGSLTRDSRGGQPHWSHGWRASASAERFDRARAAFAFSDGHPDARSFTRFNAAAEVGASFGHDPRSLRLAVDATDQRPDQGGGRFLIADLASLGGSAGLAGWEPGRFRDLDKAAAKLSYIFPLGLHLEGDLHAETGTVFPRFAAARVTDLRHSCGLAIRLRDLHQVIAMAGVDAGPESVRIRFSLGGVE